MSLSTGTRLGPYEIVSPIGAGGMGEVYKARDTRLDRIVAIKVSNEHFTNRFEREARAVAALNHPNICTLHDVGPNYLVMEYVEGAPLKGPLPVSKALEYASQILDALDAAHRKGITHRDLKPDNILVTRQGVKLLDFGLATQAASLPESETTRALTQEGAIVGTLQYMSPEQLQGRGADTRSDMFALGCVLYELLTGRRAFDGANPASVITAIMSAEPAPLDSVTAGVPPALESALRRCLAKEPDERWQSARDLKFALSAVAQIKRPAVPEAPPRWRRGVWIAAAMLMAAVLVAAVLWFRQPPQQHWSGVLLGGPEVAFAPRVSPDGHLLAFIATVGESQQVGLMNLESGDYTILTHATDKGYCNLTSWSADGARIYYDRWTDVPRGIYSVSVLGGPEQLVLEDASSPEALPDGSLLLGRYNTERQFQLFRFWPETGRVEPFPIEIAATQYRPTRAFPDGNQAVTVGTLIGPGREAGMHTYTIDIKSRQVRRLLPADSEGPSLISGFAITRDGKSVLATRVAGNVLTMNVISRDGRTVSPLPLMLTSGPMMFDAGPGGSIYLDQQNRPVELLRFSAQGGHAESIAALPAYEGPGAPFLDDEMFAILPDGRAVVNEGVGGRMRLMLAAAGKDPVRLINTAEETSSPVTAAGPGEVAFLIGPRPLRTIAVASISNGRILRKIPFDKGPITSLASSPDGRTFYCAAGGNIWSVPAGGEPRRIRAGDHVAVDPSGRYIVVQVTETPVIRLIRVPLSGGPEQELPRAGDWRPAFILGPNAIGRDARILMPLGTSTWYWPAGVWDPATGQFTRIPVDRVLDYHALGWTPDGKVMGLGLAFRSKLWKFTPETK